MTQRLRLPPLQLFFSAPRLTVLRADSTPLPERDYPEWMPTKSGAHFGFALSHAKVRRSPSSVLTSCFQPRPLILLFSKRLPFHDVAVL